MDSSDFSLHEQRRLAEIERELSADRRLVALISVLGSRRTSAWRRMRCLGIRLRRPALRSARLLVIVALCLTVAVPTLLVTAVMAGLGTLAVIAAAAMPVPVVLLALTLHRMIRSRGGIRKDFRG
jgi:Flp pilus assembly protein TadB